MAVINITDVTEELVSGSGSFDALMRTVKAQLEDQYVQNRIKGADYANVYLGSVQAVLQTALQFTLGQQQAGLEADLISAKIETEKLQQSLLNMQIAESADATIRANTQLNDGLITSQKQRDKLDTDITSAEIQIGLASAEDARKAIKLAKEIETADKQIAKLTAEITLLASKNTTEAAQAASTTQQAAVYIAQAAAFDLDAKQKTAKLMVDISNTGVAQGINLETIYSNAEAKNSINKLLAATAMQTTV